MVVHEVRDNNIVILILLMMMLMTMITITNLLPLLKILDKKESY